MLSLVEATKKVTSARKSRVDWNSVKIDFLERMIQQEGSRCSAKVVEDLSEKYNTTPKTMKAMMYKFKWLSELDVLSDQRKDKSLEALQSAEVFNESEIRIRQATAARLAIDKAVEAIRNLDPATLKVKEAIELLRLGLTEERKALGLPDLFSMVPPTVDSHGIYRSPIEHIQEQERLRRIGSRLLELVHTYEES